MADGLNEARALRVVEIMNDFRTIQLHIASHVSRAQANPPDHQSYYTDGYVVLRQCSIEAQTILASQFDPGSLGLAVSIGESEVQKASLQRIILDASTRRFQAHKTYLRAAAATRWVQSRWQVLRGEPPSSKHASALRMVDQRLADELSQIIDQQVTSNLRDADRRAGHWLDEDPSLERMLAWISMQQSS
ncbi:hypothetical protein EPUS_04060 [Endocarpon pusillum Z07020]|uniref:Uncharacterized protein n=1 Tax=Endocarpon pusillum (strain Z07020 / HMAS-L-300199) TaxID=1263415 RepID=U1G7N3_ENDPU|nr:uncharacterized protein EPUS_04060 [Endocarpon pusillum Z07020]ERF73437.1 hypothetical protein EPUS_04060 [Endocarpon pusillum Z07020]